MPNNLGQHVLGGACRIARYMTVVTAVLMGSATIDAEDNHASGRVRVCCVCGGGTGCLDSSPGTEL
jgi:hypothetical protein